MTMGHLEMAQCARDKLQASARELWSSIRSFDDGTSRNLEAESPQATENTASVSLEKLENVFKVMFGSCTSAAIPSPEVDPVDSVEPFEKRRSRSREFMSGEHVYAQLFVDDQTRAARAVDGLRERAASSSPAKSKARDRYPLATPSPPPTTKPVDVSGDFDFDDGISAISCNTLEELARHHDHKTNFYNKSNPKIESISCGGSNRRSPTKPLPPPTTTTTATLTPPSTKSATHSHTHVHTTTTPTTTTTPLQFSRGRSNGTTGSKGTKSTKSSQDSDFASLWRQDEQKFWDDVVQQEEKVEGGRRGSAVLNASTPTRQTFLKKARRRSRSGSQSAKQDVTVTTASSSSFSNLSGPFDKHHNHFHHHPHDVIQFDTRDLVANPDGFHRSTMDHCRIQKCTVAPFGSQFGEI